MPFALTLNAVSSATIADIQATANKLYNATGASEIATGTVYNATAGTITNGQNYQTALGILANKFDAATGHHHTGAAGDGPILPASGLGSFPLLGYLVQGANIVGATGTSWDVTSLMTGYTPTSSPTTPGVAVDSGHNKIRLLSAATGNAYHDLPDATGNLVYGRLSSATGSWTLSFFSEISNVETPYSFSSPQSLFWWFQQLAYPNIATPPVYIPVMDMFSTSVPSFGTFGSTPNSAGASLSGSQITLQPADATHPGGVNFSGLQTFGGNKAFNQVIPLTTSTASAAGTTTLSVTSTQIQILTGTSTQTFKLPDATTLALGQTYMFINSSTGALTIQDNASGAVFVVSAGNVCVVEVTNIGSAAGTWISRLFIPSNLTASQAIVTDANKNPASLAYSTTGSTVSSLAERDANANLSANNVLEGYTTTATAASTTTLTVASTFLQFFTGSTTQTVQLPVTSTLVLGQQFEIVNLSTGTVTVTSSGGNTVATLTANTSVVVTCILTSGTTAASWTSVAGGGGGASPLTTKGDMYTYSTVGARQPVPGDYGRLIPDSNQSTGWRSAPYTSIQQGRPGKNYVQYSDFENGATTGWSLGTVTLTSNLPTGVPTFGSGASGNLSISNTSSNPLAGSKSLSYASSAATTAGNFVASDALTIDIEDQAKVIGLRFAYSPTSNPSNGNFSGTSSNSFGVAIYDVTNSAWIIPDTPFNLIQSSGVGIFTANFQTPANMTQFRLVIYNANASAGAITMYFDDVYCGPSVAPGTALVATPTIQRFTSGSGTYTLPTNPRPLYIRVKMVGGGGGAGGSGTGGGTAGGAGGTSTFGTSLLTATGGNGGPVRDIVAVTGGTATINSPALTVVSADGAGGAGGSNASFAQGGRGGSSPFGGAGYPGGNFAGQDARTNSGSGGSGGGVVSGGTTGGGGGAGAYIEAIITNPSATYSYAVGGAGTAGTAGTSGFAGGQGGSGLIIVEEYYQNSGASNSGSNGVIAARYLCSSTSTAVSASTNTWIDFETKDYDTTGSATFGGGFKTSSNSGGWKYTIPVSGIYNVIVNSESSAFISDSQCKVYKNGSQIALGRQQTGSANLINISVNTDVNCVAGDYLEVVFFLAGASPSVNGANGQSFVAISRVPGSVVAGADASVNAAYTGAPPTGTFTNSFNTITYGTKEYDTHSAYSAGTYTVPVTGKYRISAAFGWSSVSAASGNSTKIAIHLNGTIKRTSRFLEEATNASAKALEVTGTISCVAGDLITIKSYSDTTTPGFSSAADENFFNIERVGN